MPVSDLDRMDELQRAGELIRLLRKERGLSQGDLITPAKTSQRERLHQKLLSDIEGGKPTKSNNPRRIETIQSIFDAIERHAPTQPIPTGIKHSILRGLGLIPTITLPSPAEIAAIVESWTKDYDNLPQPVYLIDIAARVHAWNVAFQGLSGMRRGDPKLANITVFDLMFSRFGDDRWKFLDREKIQRQLVHAVRVEYEQFQCDEWWRPSIRAAKASYPDFDAMWNIDSVSPLHDVTFRIMGPMRVEFVGHGLFEFQILLTVVEGDMRFFAVQYVPIDEESARKCMQLNR